ncbi:hypothetical protein ACGFX2_38970 [Streptomyces goshikiensis]|uniref:hypothetical protein n=1 Tax=Streptomyces goshikiensis TaxID=1942 RepID=UPI00371F28A8
MLDLLVGGEVQEQGASQRLAGGVTVVGQCRAPVQVAGDAARGRILRGADGVQDGQAEPSVEDGGAVTGLVVAGLLAAARRP